MPKQPTPQQPTPEEIEAMRKMIAEHDARIAEERARERRAAAQPFLDIVEGDAFKALEADLPKLVELGQTMPDIAVHVEAVSVGMFGLRQQASFLEAPVVMPIPMPAGETAPGAVVIEQPSLPSG